MRRHTSLDSGVRSRIVWQALVVGIALTVVLSMSGVGLASTFASTDDSEITVAFSDEEAGPGEEVNVSFELEGADDPDAAVGAYDVELEYDPDVLSYSGAVGDDIEDIQEYEIEDGVVKMNAAEIEGEPVPLTAAVLTFEVEKTATPGDVTDIELVDDESEFYDPIDEVTFASQSGSVTISDAAVFEVDIDSTNEPVIESHDLDVEATVENTGTEADTQTVTLLDFDGTAVDSEDVSLDAGEAETLDLTWATEIGDAGTGDVTVESDDDSAATSVEILEAPDVVASLSDEEASVGHEVTVTADIAPMANDDAGVGAYDVQVEYDADTVSFVEASGVDLPDPKFNELESGLITANAADVDGEPVPMTPVSFTFEVDEGTTPGDVADIEFVAEESAFYDPNEEVSTGLESGSITVSDLDGFEVDITSTTEPVIAGEPLAVEATVENTADSEDTQSVSLLDFDGTQVDSETVTLEGGESTTTDLTWNTEAGDAGTGDITVESDDDSATTSVEILEAPDVHVSMSDEQAPAGEEVTVTVDIEAGADSDAKVGAYDMKLEYDADTISFLAADGEDLEDPVKGSSPGEVSLNAVNTSGVSVPMTPVTLTFEVDEDAAVGDTADIEFVAEDTLFTDPIDEVTASLAGGSVTAEKSIPAAAEYRVGDVMMDGEVHVIDAVLMQQYLANLNPEPFEKELADVTRSGEFELLDIVRLQQYLAGLLDAGTVDVVGVEVGDESAEESADIVDKTALAGTEESLDGEQFVTVEFENMGDLGSLQATELRIAETEGGLDDEDALVTTPLADIPGGETLTAVVAVPEEDIDDGYWVSVTTDDNEYTVQISL